MVRRLEDYVAENKHLRRCINDLLSVLALPALWSGNEPARIIQTLADTLVNVLNLDFAYATLNHPTAAPVEVARPADQHRPIIHSQELCSFLRSWIGKDPLGWPRTISNASHDGEIAIFPQQIGLQAEVGLIVLGSERANFPTEMEKLVVGVAANQAWIGLQEGRLLREQKRLAGELDHRVAQRTAELAIVNHELRKEIAERKHAEEALQRSEAFLAEGQYLSRIGSFSWRVKTGEIIWSEQLYRIFEFDRGVPVTIELIARRIHPADAPVLNEMIERMRGGGSDLEYEHRLLMTDHSVKYLHLVAHANRDPEGELEYIGAVQDVTQRRMSEEALAGARAELAKVARATSLGVLTASMAHEVNQPLSGIITNASTCLRMLSADPPNVEGAREAVRRTMRDGNRASDVIARLRTLYSKKDPSPEWMDLNEAAREVISLSLSELQRNRITVRQELAHDLPRIEGDRIQLQQVILNLLRNASDAMSAVEDRPRELLVATEQHPGDDCVRLSVSDVGVGFKLQAVDRLFQAFYTTKEDGMGIGLSISRSIIEAHQGRLWATSNQGPGATFSFSIPYRPVASEHNQTAPNRTDLAPDAA